MTTATARTRPNPAALHLVERLAANGVQTVFGIPGVHNQAIYDALLDQPSIRSVVTRHEQGAAFMADGYARASGDVGVCCLITGPGVSNASTALAQAYSDSSPVVALVTSYLANPSQQGRRLHDMRDQTTFLRSFLKAAITVGSVEEVAAAVDEAMTLARGARPGPVAVQVPLELLDVRAPVALPGPAPQPPQRSIDTRAALDMLRAGRSPVVVVGGGSADAAAEVEELVDALRAPVVSTTAGKGIVPVSHPLSVGPWLRAEGVRRLIAAADPLILLGTEWSTTDVGEGPFPLPPNVISVNLEPDPRFAGSVQLEADVRTALGALLPELTEREDVQVEETVARLRGEARSEPRRWHEAAPYVEALRRALAPDAIVTNDMNSLSYAAAELFEAYAPRTFLAPKGFGTLGFALPAAIGAGLAMPDRQVAALVGDGGLMFTAEELVTAVRHRLTLPVVVWNNASYGAIRFTRTAAYGRSVDDDLTNPDFVAFAKACGADGMRVREPGELEEALGAALAAPRPTVIDVAVEGVG